MNSNFHNLLSKLQINQRTQDWYLKRYDILTASCIASILDANPYLSKLDLLIQKCKPFNLNDQTNDAIEWGIKYEPIACKIYEKIKDEKVHQVGLFIHDLHSWLGASPDGLRENGKLLEIKCVWNRKVTQIIPIYYWIQVQIQLEVCNLEECDLFQCKFTEYENKVEYLGDKFAIEKGMSEKTYWKLEKYSLHTIYRNREWFNDIKTILYKFWQDIIKYRKVGYKKLLNGIRDYSEMDYFSGDSKVDYIKENWTEWISASDTKNYILNDPIMDWLNLYGKGGEFNKYQKDNGGDFNEHLRNQEIEFISAIYKNLLKRFSNEIIKIANIHEKFSVNKYYQTISEMINGRPIIVQGILHNKTNLTYAMPNLIVRTDYINRIINNGIGLKKEEECKSQIGFNYRIINIKYLSLPIKNNLMINVSNIVAYKSELIICNQNLLPILGYIPNDAYILGRKYKEKEKSYDAFDNIGKIDMAEYDSKLILRTEEAINWMKEVKKDGQQWNIYKPHRKELYPNMSNQYDYPWHQFKKNLAIKNEEITLLWNCGFNERKKINENGIQSWKKINGKIIEEIIGFKERKKKILENIIKVNAEDNGCILNPNNSKIDASNFYFFIDFETVNNLDFNFEQLENYNLKQELIDINDDNLIYLIGIGWRHPIMEKWVFKNFLVDRLDLNNEKKIIIQWLKYMKKIQKKFLIKKYKICHWSSAEIIFSNRAFKRHNIKMDIEWYDLLNFFKQNFIAIRGAFNYSLKIIANSLYENKLIKTQWHDTTIDGTSAMLAAWEAENLCKQGQITKLKGFRKIGEILKYNEIDCKTLYEIMALFI